MFSLHVISYLTFCLLNIVSPSLSLPPKGNNLSTTVGIHRYEHVRGFKSQKVPVFVAHRGDKFLLPEHTIPAYDVAMLENVDYVEPDLVLTSDGHLVCHHDITLREGTDVGERSEFRDKMTQSITLFLDGKNVTIENDWLISNFTLEELKTLKVNQKGVGVRPQFFNNLYGIPTFQEYIEAVHKDTWRRHAEVTQDMDKGNDVFVMGMIPELKHPIFHNGKFQEEHFMEKTFMEVLNNSGYLDNKCQYNYSEISCSPLVVQCFDVGTIMYLSDSTNLTLLTLLDTNNLRYLTYDGFKQLEGKTTYVGLWKELLFTGTEAELEFEGREYNKTEMESLGGFIGPKEFVEFANNLGIHVGIYTIYHSREPSKRGCAIKCVKDSKETELQYYFDLGVEMFFVEGICESMRIRERYFTKLQYSKGAAHLIPSVKLGTVLGVVLLTLFNSCMS